MTISTWLMIIAKILELMAGGMSKQQAVANTADIFHVSESDIWSHGGF